MKNASGTFDSGHAHDDAEPVDSTALREHNRPPARQDEDLVENDQAALGEEFLSDVLPLLGGIAISVLIVGALIAAAVL